MRVLSWPLAAVTAGCVLALGGCGGEDIDERGRPALTSVDEAGEGGTLVWAVADRVRTIDPLLARTRAERIVSRQIHEPLAESLSGPFGDVRRRPGLARWIRPSEGKTVWSMKLRSGVRFQDGTAFNGEAVAANAQRWLDRPAGRRLLPTLLAYDTPRPGEVRFILSEADPRFDRRLAASRLGIVSPKALRRPPLGALALRDEDTGTGAFELREREAQRQLLARNTSWWGSRRGLGPALTQVLVRTEPNPNLRFALLDAGDAQLADQLPSEQARLARADPLLTALRARDGSWLGLDRSVRGVSSANELPSLAGAWLTRILVAE